MNDGVYVIVGTSRASSFNTIRTYCQALQMPYILATPSRPSSIEGSNFDLSVCPPYIDAVMKVVANLTLRENRLFYVYDSDDGKQTNQILYSNHALRFYNQLIIISLFCIRAWV